MLNLHDDRACHRCGEPVTLTARVPHAMTRSDGLTIEGFRSIVLCPLCDSADPDAQGVLAFFTLHQTITDDNVGSAASLIDEWAHRIAHRAASGDLEDGIDEETRRWIDGEL